MKLFENISSDYKRIATGIAIVGFLSIMYIALIPGGIQSASATVFDIMSGEGIGGAFVKIVEWPQYNATTSSELGYEGNYTINNVPIGTYNISASKHGYFPNTTTVTVEDGLTSFVNFQLTPGNMVYVPWTVTNQGWVSPYVIANKGASEATMNIDYYDRLSGQIAGSYNSFKIMPNSSKFVYRDWNASGTDGSAVLISDKPISLMVNQFYLAGNLFNAYEVENSSSNQIFIPWTATLDGWTTPFVIVNQGTENAMIDITYYNLDGTVAGTYPNINMPSGVSTFFYREWNATGSDGAAKVNSSQPISVLVETFKGTKFGAYTPSSMASTKVFIPWTITTQGWTSPYRIVNTGSSTALVNISYYDQITGQNAGNDSIYIPAKGVATMFRETSPASGTDGSAVLNSTQPITVMVEEYVVAGGMYEAYTPSMVDSNIITLPWTVTTQGWTSPFVIGNKGDVNATVVINYYNQADGSSAGTYTLYDLLPGASKFVYRESTTSNTDGSAVLISNQPIAVLVDEIYGPTNMLGAYTGS